MSNLFSRFYDEAGVHGNGENMVHHLMHIHGQSVRVVKIGYPIVDNVTGTIIYRGEDISCDWENDKKCSHLYWTNPPHLNLHSPPLKDSVVVPAMGYIYRCSL